MNSTGSTRGFTLIELLVVIGVIAVLAGGIGAALLRGNPGKALQNAQGTAGSLITVARSRAALAQADAAVFVNVEPDSEGFLRELRVAVLAASGRWAAVDDPVVLDRGVFFVPPIGVVAASDADFEPNAGAWNNLRSNGFGNSGITLRLPDDSDDFSSDEYRMVERFNSRGGVESIEPEDATHGVPYRRIVLSAARIESDKIVFDNPDAVRGYLITRYGIGVLVNDDEAFRP